MKYFKRNGLHWIIIFISLYFCLPLGAVLAIHKSLVEKHRFIENGRVLQVLGVPLILIYLLITYVISLNADASTNDINVGMAAALLVFGVPGLLICLYGKYLVKLGNKYNIYYSILEKEQKLDEISKFNNKSISETTKDLEKMIKLKLLGKSIINYDENIIYLDNEYEFILPKTKSLKNNKSVQNSYTLSKKEDEFDEVICPNCGAINKAKKGSQIKCEYCDSTIAN